MSMLNRQLLITELVNNPILHRELKLRFYDHRLWWLGLGVTWLCLSVSGFGVLTIASSPTNSLDAWVGMLATVTNVTLGIMSLIATLMASTVITRERERRTWELLLMAPLQRFSLVIAKLVGAVSITWVWTIMCLPALCLPYAVGDIMLSSTLLLIAFVFLTQTFFATIGLFWSAIARNSRMSMVGSIITLLAFGLGTIVIDIALAQPWRLSFNITDLVLTQVCNPFIAPVAALGLLKNLQWLMPFQMAFQAISMAILLAWITRAIMWIEP